MKVTSNVRNVYREVHAPITWNLPTAAQPVTVNTPTVGPTGTQAAAPDTITSTWRSLPSVGTWRPLGDITESRWQNTPITWNSGRLPNAGTSLTATVELPELLSMVGCPTAIFFSIGVELGVRSVEKDSDWNCFVNVANLFASSQLTNPGFLIRDSFAEFTGCVYGNLRKTLRDTRISVTMNGFYGSTLIEARDFVHFNVNGSALTLS